MDLQLKETLEDISKRLAALESNQQRPIQEQIEEQPNVDSNVNTVNNGVSTQPIDESIIGGACSKDYLREFDQIRERLAKVSLPSELKVNDNSNGIKTESRPALKVVSKSARFAETNLKQIALISARIQNGSVSVSEQEIETLYTISAVNVQFAQAEYANIVVKNSFDEETARLFRAFENHSSAFQDTSLQSLRVAAELSASRERTAQRGRALTRQTRSNNYSRFPRGRGRPEFNRFTHDWQHNRPLPNNFNNGTE